MLTAPILHASSMTCEHLKYQLLWTVDASQIQSLQISNAWASLEVVGNADLHV